jgi:cell wall-associated NlpC family hydrolase
MSLRRNALQIVIIALSGLGSISLAATYTVKPGESLYGIARAFGSSVAELQRLNKLETPAVRVGQVIVVPESATARPNVRASVPVSHQVAAGETLYAIARKYAVDVETLQRLNKLESPVVKVGQTLLIPSVVKPAVSSPEVKPVVTLRPTVSSKPAEVKPVETKPASSNLKPVESKPASSKPIESKPVVRKPVESKPVESKPVESKPSSSKPIEVKPVVATKPVEPKPIETKPTSSNPKPVPTPTVSPKPTQSVPKPDLKPVPLGGSSASGKPVRAVTVGKFVLDQGSSRLLPNTPSLGGTESSGGQDVNTSPSPNLEGPPGHPVFNEPLGTTPTVPTPEVRPAVPSSNSAGATRIPIKVIQSAPLPDLGPITGQINGPDSSTDGITPTHSTDPTGNGPEGEAVVSTTGPISAGGTIQYTVVYGDSLYRISVKYGLTVEAIKAANKLTSDALSVGQVLNIPGENLVSTVKPPSGIPASTPSSTLSGNVTTGAGLRTVAERYLGVTYVFGGTTPNGLDCSGLVYLVYQELGVQLPRTSRLQYQVGEEISREDLREGDLVFFNTTGQGVSHVGIYLEDGDFINAASNPGKVMISNLSESYWDKRYLGARRVITSPIPSDQPGEDVQP